MRHRHQARTACLCAAALTVGLCPPRVLRGQEPGGRAQNLPGVYVQRRAPGPPPRCHGETITSIDVEPYPPFMRGLLQRWQFVSRTIGDLHTTTQPDVIANFLQLREGDACTELRRAESERILRAQPFLAAAVVRPEPDGPGRVKLVVETVDEVTLIAGLRANTSSPNLRMLRAGEGNLMGQAIRLSAEWRAGTYGRTGASARLIDYQLLGRPYQLTVEGDRFQIGGQWRTAIEHPYFTDLQRLAWRAEGGAAHDFFELVGDGGEFRLALGSRRDFASVGGVVRVGLPGRLSLFGAALTQEREDVDVDPVRLTADGPVPVPMSLLGVRPYPPKRSARINALWGVRNISFMTADGFDALSAVQDVRVGFQTGLRFGRSLGMAGSRDDDIFVAGDLYAGYGGPSSFVTFQGRGEGRQDYDTDRWDGVLGSARLAWYAHLAPSQTLLTSAEWAGGWRSRRPFQLLLGDDQGGVRGYGGSEVAGARRAVVRLESRWRLGELFETAEYGMALFADAGKTSAGDVPFGVDSPIAAGLGVSLLAAVPRGSQRLWRLDLAYPVTADPRARFEVRLSSTNLSRRGWREPEDVRRSREQAMKDGLFNWP